MGLRRGVCGGIGGGGDVGMYLTPWVGCIDEGFDSTMVFYILCTVLMVIVEWFNAEECVLTMFM